MVSTTVSTKIVIEIDDRSAKKALENFKKTFEEIERMQVNDIPSKNIFESIQRDFAEIERITKELDQARRDRNDRFFTDLENMVLKRDTVGQAQLAGELASFMALFPQTVGVAATALGSFYAVWKTGQFLEEWRVGDKPVDEYLKVVGDSFESLPSTKPLELQIVSQDISEQLSEVERLKRQFEEQRGLFLHLNLNDEATDEAFNVRNILEKTFKDPITQIIKIEQVQGSINLRKSPSRLGSGDSGGDFSDSSSGSGDSGGGFDGSSVNPGGFGDTFGSFSTGIDRVPRDMLAMIHKDETVLTKTEAEERRSGNSGGMAIQRVSINMNMPDSFNPSNMKRQDFRQFAMKMQDELRRLDRRMSR